MVAIDPSYQFLACQYLRGQLEILMNELRGVRANEDLEPVHQARVASRRIRAALRMFADCFESKRLEKWQRQIRKLTKELGEARDKDVQIEFVEGFLERLDRKDGKHRPGIERLLLRLRQKRTALQPEVVEVLDRLEGQNTLAQMYGHLEETLFTLRSRDVQVCSPYVYETAAAHIRARKQDFASCEPALDDPGDANGHHQLRIAAKKLRYTMEICDPAYGGHLADVVKAVKQVQSFLGDIHDCDVWAQDIDALMEQERRATVEYYGQARPFYRLRPGLLLLRENRLAHRHETFAVLLEYWEQSGTPDFWNTLESTLESRMAAMDSSCQEGQNGQIDGTEEQTDEDRPDR